MIQRIRHDYYVVNGVEVKGFVAALLQLRQTSTLTLVEAHAAVRSCDDAPFRYPA